MRPHPGNVRLCAALLVFAPALLAGCASLIGPEPPQAYEPFGLWEMRPAKGMFAQDLEWRVGPYLLQHLERTGAYEVQKFLDPMRGRKHLEQQVQFRMLDEVGDSTLQATCSIDDLRTKVLITLRVDRRMRCRFHAPEDTASVATLEVFTDYGAEANGTLRIGGTEYRIGSQLARHDLIARYELLRDEELLGSVERHDRPGIRFTPAVRDDERHVMALAAIALLLRSVLLD
jgi:hypothetical protein